MVNVERAQHVVDGRNKSLMALFIFNGRAGLSDEEIALGTPDESEADNLKHHVSRCAYRYRMFAKRQAIQGDDIAQVKYMVLGLIAVVCITSPQIRNFVEWLGKFL